MLQEKGRKVHVVGVRNCDKLFHKCSLFSSRVIFLDSIKRIRNARPYN